MAGPAARLPGASGAASWFVTALVMAVVMPHSFSRLKCGRARSIVDLSFRDSAPLRAA
jgi:hypothetical protein